MVVTKTGIEGCYVIEPRLFEDQRGFFAEAYNERVFLEHGLPLFWPQDNLSGSAKGVLRGMHIQRRNPQGKLVRCVQGKIIDVCLDLRRESPTFMNFHSEILEGARSLYCPPGTAHGFLAIGEGNNVVYYKCTSLYDAETDGGVNALTGLSGVWGMLDSYTMSEKDQHLPDINEWLADKRGVWWESKK